MILKCALPAIRNTSSEGPFSLSQVVSQLEGNVGWPTTCICPFFYFLSTLKWKFSTFGPFCNPGALPGWKERKISSEFSLSNPEWCADVKGRAGSHPEPHSPSYFHWVHLFWLKFSPHPGVTIFPGERKMQDSAGWSHRPRYWESGSVAWPLIFLKHLNYSYSIRHIWRKEIGLSQVADVSAGMYGWKLILWHRLMKPAVSWNTDIYFIYFFITQDLCATRFP